MSHLRREFIKVLFQKRTYFGWAGLFVVPFLDGHRYPLPRRADWAAKTRKGTQESSTSASSQPTVSM